MTPTLINLSKLKIGLGGDKFIPIQKSLAPIRFIVAEDDQFVPSLESVSTKYKCTQSTHTKLKNLPISGTDCRKINERK